MNYYTQSNNTPTHQPNNEKGFTLIELIMVIVLLGLLAVVAVPKYQDMKSDAETAQANGVLGAAQGAAAINFANGLINSGVTPITTGATLMEALDSTPDGWTLNGTDEIRNTSLTTIHATNGAVITIDSVETSTAKAVLSGNW